MLPITQIGRIVREVELKEQDINGEINYVVNNSLAIRANKETTVFIDFTAWGKVAENISKFYKKGNEILLTGELRSRKIKVDGKEANVLFILVKGYDFTYGNSKPDSASSCDDSQN